MIKKNKQLGKILSKAEMKKIMGGRIILPDFGCLVRCCYGYGPLSGCEGYVSIAVETCNNIPWGCWLPETTCTCMYPS